MSKNNEKLKRHFNTKQNSKLCLVVKNDLSKEQSILKKSIIFIYFELLSSCVEWQKSYTASK